MPIAKIPHVIQSNKVRLRFQRTQSAQRGKEGTEEA